MRNNVLLEFLCGWDSDPMHIICKCLILDVKCKNGINIDIIIPSVQLLTTSAIDFKVLIRVTCFLECFLIRWTKKLFVMFPNHITHIILTAHANL
jgi:hypothetical protein